MDTRTRLVEAMQDLLWERGYVGTSPKAVQERAGAGQGSMYHHFSGKADLAVAAVQRTAAQQRELVESTLHGPGTPVERITAHLRRERAALRGCRIGGLTYDPDVITDPDLRAPLEETLRWSRERMARVLVEGQEAGELRTDMDADQVAAALVAVLQGGYVLARASGDPADYTRATEGAVALLNGIRAGLAD